MSSALTQSSHLQSSTRLRLLALTLEALSPPYTAALVEAGFELRCTGSLGDAVRDVLASPPDVVLAVCPPAMASSICQVFSALGPQALVIAAPELPPRVAVACLDEAADAVITLPMAAGELVARLQAVCRRTAGQAQDAPSKVVAGDLTLDLGTREVRLRGRRIDLSPTEFQVLAVLAAKPGKVVTNRELLAEAWSEECTDDLHYVRLYIGYLRAKIEKDPRHPELIVTQWGVGYRLVVEPAAADETKAG